MNRLVNEPIINFYYFQAALLRLLTGAYTLFVFRLGACFSLV